MHFDRQRRWHAGFASLALLSLPSSLLPACGPATPATDPSKLTPRPHPIQVKGDFAHPASGALFPKRIGGMQREQPKAYDHEERDVSASYVEGGLRITAYVYPAGPAASGRLRGELLRSAGQVELGYGGLHATATRVVADPSAHPFGSGFERSWNGPVGSPQRIERLQVFQCGQWFLKLRATCGPSQAAGLDSALASVQRTVSCTELAMRHPAGAKLVIQMSPEVDDQTAATWLMYGAGLALWVKQNAAPQEPAFGVPDHRHDMYLTAVKDALDVYRQMSSKGEPKAATFEHLVALQDTGLLEEVVWSWQLDFVDPDPALGLDMAGFQAWTERHAPGLSIAQMSGIAYQ
jgi:hypothetical protein